MIFLIILCIIIYIIILSEISINSNIKLTKEFKSCLLKDKNTQIKLDNKELS